MLVRLFFLLLLSVSFATVPPAFAQPWNAARDSDDGPASTVAELSLTRLRVRALSRFTPVCLLYVSNGHAPNIAPRFRFALKISLAELEKSSQRVGKVTLSYARSPKTTNAQQHVDVFQEYVKRKVKRGVIIVKEAAADLHKVALCGQKPTILIHDNTTSFYNRALPAATIWGGSISLYDTLFIRLQ